MHTVDGNCPEVERSVVVLLVPLFVIGFLITVPAPAAMDELAMTFR